MQKLILLFTILFTASFTNAQTQCNPTLTASSTTVISSTMLMDTTNSVTAQGNILICGGNTLTYNSWLGKDFFVRSGATLILKSAQIARINMEPGATLIFDTNGAVFNGTIIAGIAYDSTNVTFVDTNQIYTDTAAVYWNNCIGNTFVYSGFTPAQPCVPLSVIDNKFGSTNLKFENPVQNEILLSETVLDQFSEASVFDISGKLVKKHSRLNQPIDVSYLPQGIYILQLNGKNGSSTVSKFIKD